MNIVELNHGEKLNVSGGYFQEVGEVLFTNAVVALGYTGYVLFLNQGSRAILKNKTWKEVPAMYLKTAASLPVAKTVGGVMLLCLPGHAFYQLLF